MKNETAHRLCSFILHFEEHQANFGCQRWNTQMKSAKHEFGHEGRSELGHWEGINGSGQAGGGRADFQGGGPAPTRVARWGLPLDPIPSVRAGVVVAAVELGDAAFAVPPAATPTKYRTEQSQKFGLSQSLQKLGKVKGTTLLTRKGRQSLSSYPISGSLLSSLGIDVFTNSTGAPPQQSALSFPLGLSPVRQLGPLSPSI